MNVEDSTELHEIITEIDMFGVTRIAVKPIRGLIAHSLHTTARGESWSVSILIFAWAIARMVPYQTQDQTYAPVSLVYISD